MVEKSNLLIITGPQGSGNHLFSKLFNLHPDVYGWDMEKYWVGHHTEPFSEYWTDPSKLKYFNWGQSNYYITSISCPYFKFKNPQIPKYKEFIEEAKKYSNIKIALLGRDSSILTYQQMRVRKEHTTPIAFKEFEYIHTLNPYYLSFELLFLYKQNYLKKVSNDLQFPIETMSKKFEEILRKNSNHKYIKYLLHTELDKDMYISSHVES